MFFFEKKSTQLAGRLFSKSQKFQIRTFKNADFLYPASWVIFSQIPEIQKNIDFQKCRFCGPASWVVFFQIPENRWNSLIFRPAICCWWWWLHSLSYRIIGSMGHKGAFVSLNSCEFSPYSCLISRSPTTGVCWGAQGHPARSRSDSARMPNRAFLKGK